MSNPTDDLDLGEDLGDDLVTTSSQQTNTTQSTEQSNTTAPKVDLEINTKKQAAVSNKDKIKKWKILTGVFAGVSALAIGGACAGPLIVNSMNKTKTVTKWNVALFCTEGLEVSNVKEIDKGKDLTFNVKTPASQKPSLVWSYFILTGQDKKKLEEISSTAEFSSYENEQINWTVTIPADKITNNIAINISPANVTNLNYEYDSAEATLIDTPFLKAGEAFSTQKFKNVAFEYNDNSVVSLPESEWSSLIVTDNETLNPLKESEPFQLDTTSGVWQTRYSVKYRSDGTPFNFNKKIIDDELKETTTGSGGFTIDNTKNYIGIKVTAKEDITNFRTLVLTISNGTYSYDTELDNLYAYYKKDDQWKNIEIIGASDGLNTKLIFNNQENIDDCREFYICYHNIPEESNDSISISVDFEDITKINIQEGTYSATRNTSRSVDIILNLNLAAKLEGLRYKNNKVKFYSDSECSKEVEIENLYYTNSYVKIPKDKLTLGQIYFKPQLEAASQTAFDWEITNNTASVYFNQNAAASIKEATGASVPEKFGNMPTGKVTVQENDGQNWYKLTSISLPETVEEYINFKDFPELTSLTIENGTYSETQANSLTDVLNSISLKTVTIKEISSEISAKWKALFTAEWGMSGEGSGYITFTKA